jgi:predicted RNA-binding Zn-ribbon protein involved in translation (DUF1610 family)
MEHIQAYHDFPCPYCSQTFNSLAERDAHIASSHTYTCPYCGVTLIGTTNYDSHVSGCPSNPVNQTFTKTFNISIKNNSTRGGIAYPASLKYRLYQGYKSPSATVYTQISDDSWYLSMAAGENRPFSNLQYTYQGTKLGYTMRVIAEIRDVNNILVDSMTKDYIL